MNKEYLVPIPELDYDPNYKANLETGKIWSERSQRYLDPKQNEQFGYRFSTFRTVDGKSKPYSIHSLIMSAGMGVKCGWWLKQGLQINHRNGKHDDSFNSLELCTHKQQYETEYDPNVRSKLGNGKRLSKSDVRVIREAYKAYEGKVSYLVNWLAWIYDVHYTTIKRAIDFKSHKKVSKLENMSTEDWKQTNEMSKLGRGISSFDLKKCIDDISKSVPVMGGKDNMIELDPNNPHHREWFEVDKYKGEELY